MPNFYMAIFPRDFANEANIYAFSSRYARDKFVEKEDLKRDSSYRAYRITRRDASRMLSPRYLDPGTLNCISGVNVYLGSRNEWTEKERQEKQRQWLEDWECGALGDLPIGLTLPYVRL